LDGLRDELHRRGVLSPTGRPFWTKETLRHTLTNRIYVGDFLWNRETCAKFSRLLGGEVLNQQTPMRGKKKKGTPNDPADWLVVPDQHEALIDRDTFG